MPVTVLCVGKPISNVLSQVPIKYSFASGPSSSTTTKTRHPYYGNWNNPIGLELMTFTPAPILWFEP